MARSCASLLLALPICVVQLAAGAILLGDVRSSPHTRRQPPAALAQSAAGASSVAEVERRRILRQAELTDVAQDLTVEEKRDDTDVQKMEKQIVALVRQRDQLKRDEARKAREISFIDTELGQVSTAGARQVAQATAQLSSADATAAAAGQAGAATDTVAESDADSAVASAENLVKLDTSAALDTAEASKAQASASVSSGSTQASAEAAAAEKAAAEKAAAEAAAAQKASAEAAAAEKAKQEAAIAEAAKQEAASAEAAAAEKAKDQALSAEATASERAALKAKMVAEAEVKMRAEAEAEAKAKVAQEQAEKQHQEEARQKEAAEAEAAKTSTQKKQDAIANSADDSFKDFMKEEDGEDEQGDPDYEASANALSSAIGWDRKQVESNADSAVKQLTEAIGGKKVVGSLQAMMGGLGR